MLLHQTGYTISTDIRNHDHQASLLHEFHYFLDGHGWFKNGTERYAFQPGSLFYSRPEDRHEGQVSDSKQRFELYYVLFYHDPKYSEYLDRLAALFPQGAPRQLGRSLGSAMENLRRRAGSPDALIRTSADFSFLTLLCDLEATKPEAWEGPARQYIDEALAMMQAQLNGGLSLENIVEHLGINKSYFVRLFKAAVGVPPMRYYLNLRLDTATYRLATSHANLRQVALDLGFHDEFHFSHQFKVYKGLSPQAYRQSSDL